MFPLLLELAYNLALLVALSVISGFIKQRRNHKAWAPVFQGALFGAAAVIGMLRPLVLGPGLIFDGRSVMISLCGLFFGPLAVAIAGGMALLYRSLLGGPGVYMGILVIAESALLGLLFHHRWTRRGTPRTVGRLWGLGLLVHVVMLMLMFTLPAGMGLSTFKRVGLPVLVAYPLVTILIGRVLSIQEAGMRAVEALKNSEALLRAIADSVPDPIFLKGLDGSYLFANSAMLQVIGKTREQVLGKTDDEIYDDPAVVAALVETDRRIMDNAAGEVVEEVVPGPAGYRTYRSNKAPYRDFGGQVAGLIGCASDITERKRAEEALRDERRLFMGGTTVVFKWQAKEGWPVEYVSPNVEAQFGFAPEQMTDAAFVFADLVHPEDLVRVAGEVERYSRDGLSCFEQEYRLARADGEYRWIYDFTVPIRDGEGTITHFHGYLLDITERKRLEGDKARLESQLQQAQKMESLGSLAGGVAHDMNNVLGAILGMASANIDAQSPGSPVHQAFDTIIKAATRGGKLVRSLLGFARQSPAEERELDVNAVLREEIRILERTTLARIRLELDLAEDLRLIRGDASALTHTFMNLCVNSIDAMPGEGTLALRSRNVDNDWIEISVEDTGTGMPKEVLEKALDPFYTTKSVGKGTGLGLSMVYNTVKAHRGQLELLSEPGRGTLVRVRFPACEPAGQAVEPVVETRTAATPRVLTVLVVDDDELIRCTTEALLEIMGHRAVISTSGEEALAELESGLRPDVVILDMNMPGLGGAGTLPRLRVLDSSVPVLLATGRVDQCALDLVGAHSCVTLLPKPFTAGELRQQLEAVDRG